jgi:hypothetical protein
MQRDNPDFSIDGLISKTGDKLQPLSVKINP